MLNSDVEGYLESTAKFLKISGGFWGAFIILSEPLFYKGFFNYILCKEDKNKSNELED